MAKTLKPVTPSHSEAEAGFVTVDGVYRKIKKVFQTVGGVHNLLWSFGVDVAAMTIGYTGKHTDEIVTMGDGKQYRLLTLTSTGTLTLEEEVNADIWLCNGGASGAKGEPGGGYSKGGAGGAGGKFSNVSGMLATSHAITVGAAAGVSSISGFTLSWKTGSGGGTGANAFGHGAGGSKASGDTRPFADSYFTSYPCAGGGGGAAYNSVDDNGHYYMGGSGGSSKGAGSAGSGLQPYASDGGVTGGGKGQGRRTTDAGSAGSYYGSGGGGGYGTTAASSGSGYSGYQGLVVIRIPLEQ